MDTYQAVYEATRSRIFNGDVGAAIQDVCRQSFDISYAVQGLQGEFSITAYEMRRPSVLFRPQLARDGNQWCALYGENLHDGVVGFGDTPEKAMIAFDVSWLNEKCEKGVGL